MAFPNEQIIYRVTQGDEAAFSQLCSHFHIPAFKFCTVLLKDEKEAECIIKDVFAKMWDDRTELKSDDSFKSYLFMSLRNQIFAQLRTYTDPVSRKQYLDRIETYKTK